MRRPPAPRVVNRATDVSIMISGLTGIILSIQASTGKTRPGTRVSENPPTITNTAQKLRTVPSRAAAVTETRKVIK